MLKRKSIREILSGRPTLILDKPVVQNLNPRRDLNPGQGGADSSLEKMREDKKAEWRSKGYPENWIGMAIDLADDWTSSMGNAFAPPGTREAVIRYTYPKGLEVAGNWLRTMAVPSK